MSMPITPIKTQVLGEAIDLGTTELNAMVKKLDHVTIDFSALPMYEVYSIQNVAVTEMKVKEGALVKTVRASNKTIHKTKRTIKEVEQNLIPWSKTSTSLMQV